MNTNELKVLKACTDNALDAAGGDFGFSDEIAAYLPEMNANQVAGYLSAISEKGMIYLDYYKTDSSEGNQITFPKEAFDTLIEKGMIDTDYANKFQAYIY